MPNQQRPAPNKVMRNLYPNPMGIIQGEMIKITPTKTAIAVPVICIGFELI